MNRLITKIGVGMLGLLLVVGVTLLAQGYINTQTSAAETLTGSNEVIAVATTDGLPVNNTVTVDGYSGDGNVILFRSSATNLPDPGTYAGIYTYNISSNSTTRVDISDSGVVSNGAKAGYGPTIISETGRYVLFSSTATNLIDGTTKPANFLYKKDLQTGLIQAITPGTVSGDSSKWDRNLAISNDGRFLLISSRYLANSYPNNYGYALGDGSSGTYTWTSLAVDEYYSPSGAGDISCDGSLATFRDTYWVYLTDIRKNVSTPIATGASSSTSPLISCNGRYVLYATTDRTQISPTPTGMSAYMHLVRYDRITGERTYVDSNSAGTFSSYNLAYSLTESESRPNIFKASISDSGDIVLSYNGASYLKHLSDGSGTLESIAKDATGSPVSVNNGEITSNGQYIFFQADPYNLGIGTSPAGTQIIRTKANLH